jgi:hypothetical protein
MTSSKFNPAFPPQIAQDNFGRVIAPVPGLSKLEHFALSLLPYYLHRSEEIDIDPFETTIKAAQLLIDKLDAIKPDALAIESE